jgi:hypothetical protein
MRILRKGLLSVETISITFILFGRPEDILEAEVTAGEWLRNFVKKKMEKIGRVWYVKLIWEAEKGDKLEWKKQSDKSLEWASEDSNLIQYW